MEDQVPFDKLTFRQGLSQLESIVQSIEGNTLELEDSLAAYERGIGLFRHLNAQLDASQQKVDVLMGTLDAAPSDEDADANLNKA